MQRRIYLTLAVLLSISHLAMAIVRVQSAEAAPSKGKSHVVAGEVDEQAAHFKDVDPQTIYDVKLTLDDGVVLQGVNMRWYSIEPERPDAGELSDDDRGQITAVLKDIPAFYNKNDLLILRGNHDRAVALVQLVRDSAFHSDKGGEVIWHVELWYFKNQHGGWEKVQQANRIVRRERFASAKAYHDVIDHLRWVPELGGLKPAEGSTELTVNLPATEPAAQPAGSDTVSTQPAR
ncbi:MAG TPA: hypothetical protein VLI90_14050 [Tepidisphaeraceae bacterium]|nr:hypothetical protein [Tepidisphaeraceae bacterium]